MPDTGLIDRMMVHGADGKPQDVYRAQDGGYFLTYGGGQVSRPEIDQALEDGLIEPAYPGSSDWWRLA